MRSREVLMCSDRYAADIPLRFPNTQLPPMRSDFSKQSNSMPASCSFFAAAIPDDPAPITHALGSRGLRVKRDTGVSFYHASYSDRNARSHPHGSRDLERRPL